MDYEKQISAQNNIDVMTWQNGLSYYLYFFFFLLDLLHIKSAGKCHVIVI